MAYIKKIQGTGVISDASDLGSNLPNHKDYALNDYDTIAAYNALEWNESCSFLCLFKKDATLQANFLLSTRGPGVNHRGIYILVNTDNSVYFTLSTDTARNVGIYTNLKSTFGKWNALVINYDGSGNASGIACFVNGIRSEMTVFRNIQISTTVKQPVFYINQDVYSVSKSEVKIPILTIYKSILTPSQILEFNANPFGFNNALDINNCNLKVDFNKTNGDELTDLSINAHTITAVNNKNFAQFP